LVKKIVSSNFNNPRCYLGEKELEFKGKIRVEIYALIYDGENSSANSYDV
jgi:hypothetical protein